MYQQPLPSRRPASPSRPASSNDTVKRVPAAQPTTGSVQGSSLVLVEIVRKIQKSAGSLRELFCAMQRECEAGTAVYLHRDCHSDAAPTSQQRRGAPVLEPHSPAPLSEPMTYFHSRFVPRLSLEHFGAAILRASIHCDDLSLLIALVLMQRFANITGTTLTLHMMHRLFIACLLVGAKAHQDVFPCNMLLAKVAGMQCSELNRLEMAVLDGIQWCPLVRVRHIDDYLARYSKAAPTLPARGESPQSATSSEGIKPSPTRALQQSQDSSAYLADTQERSVDSVADRRHAA